MKKVLIFISFIVLIGCSSRTEYKVTVSIDEFQEKGLLTHTEKELDNLINKSFNQGSAYNFYIIKNLVLLKVILY